MMTCDEVNRALAEDFVLQLQRSERGRGALAALSVFLSHGDTYGLDFENQAAVLSLVGYAFRTPSVREIIEEASARAESAPHAAVRAAICAENNRPE